MKKLRSTLLLLLFTLFSFSQIVFNNIYDEIGPPNIRNVIIQPNNYFSSGGCFVDSLMNSIGIAINKFSLNGELIEYKIYRGDTLDWVDGRENSLRETNTSNYIIGGNRGKDYFRDNLLIKLDYNLDTIFTKVYYSVNDSGNMDVLIHNTGIDTDGNYLLIGETNIDNDYNIYPMYQMQLIKTDTMGNLLWRKTYGDNNYTYKGYKVMPAINGGYIIGGWSSKNNGDWCLVKTDENGDNPIYKYYGHPSYLDGRVGGITQTKDSCYIITGYHGVNVYNYCEATIMKLDRNLNLIWEKQYLNITPVSFFVKAFEKENGNILVHGLHKNSESDAMGILMELTSNGDSLWRQTLTCLDTTDTENYIECAKITPDGGVILAGWTSCFNLDPTQQMCLIKTDSMGCDGTHWTSCGAVDIVEPIAQNNTEAGLRVYPNPTSGNLQFTIYNLQPSTENQPTSKKLDKLSTLKLDKLVTTEQFNNLTIDQKLAYNIKHPEQKLWGKAEEKEMLELSRKHAIMLPFDVLRGKSDIFAIEPALNVQFTMDNEQKNNVQSTVYNEQLSTSNYQLSINIYDIYGRLVKSVNRTFQFDEEITINVSDLNRGIYLLRVGGESVKFVKE